jgi:Fe-S-cluster containining protein
VGACRSCEGRCCAAYRVPINGDDVWRIVQGQRLAPAVFVAREPEPHPTAESFLLRPGGGTFTLRLRYQYERRNERPCVFLMRLRDGVQRCGIYPHRPHACQTYPMQRTPDGVAPRADMMCPPGSWTTVPERVGPWAERMREQDAAWRRYERVVAPWNAAVQRLPAHEGFVLEQYLAYLVAAYDALAARGGQPLNDAALAQIVSASARPDSTHT